LRIWEPRSLGRTRALQATQTTKDGFLICAAETDKSAPYHSPAHKLHPTGPWTQSCCSDRSRNYHPGCGGGQLLPSVHVSDGRAREYPGADAGATEWTSSRAKCRAWPAATKARDAQSNHLRHGPPSLAQIMGAHRLLATNLSWCPSFCCNAVFSKGEFS
jgi:hypothetical protein